MLSEGQIGQYSHYTAALRSENNWRRWLERQRRRRRRKMLGVGSLYSKSTQQFVCSTRSLKSVAGRMASSQSNITGNVSLQSVWHTYWLCRIITLIPIFYSVVACCCGSLQITIADVTLYASFQLWLVNVTYTTINKQTAYQYTDHFIH